MYCPYCSSEMRYESTKRYRGLRGERTVIWMRCPACGHATVARSATPPRAYLPLAG